MRVPRFLALFWLCLGATALYAFTITPMTSTFEPRGKGAAQVFRVENGSPNRVAFQITILTRDLDESGGETNQPAAELFTVFPRQGTIGPGLSQSVRVVWRGPPAPEREMAFRLMAEELPVNFDPDVGKVQIRVILRYMAALYVTPRNAHPSLEVSSFSRTETNTYVMKVINKGKMHQNLMKPRLTLIDSQGRRKEVPKEALQTFETENILADRARRFEIVLPNDFTEPNYQAELVADE